jgi:hypothetical protein
MNAFVEASLSGHRLESHRRPVGLNGLPIPVSKHWTVKVVLLFAVHSFVSRKGVSHDRNPAPAVALRAEVVLVPDIAPYAQFPLTVITPPRSLSPRKS